MRLVAITLSVLLSSPSVALAQGNPSGRGSITGDPAASTSNPRAEPPATTGSRSSISGSGTSTSGGKDHNMDGGRDKKASPMPTDNDASIHVLVVEDDPELRAVIVDYLEDAGCLVLESGTAERAISLCKLGLSIDAVFTDVHLRSSLTGWDVGEAAPAARLATFR